ncbi:MAG: shikimate dehydrogenase [Rubrivivax sp.]|nr:shikimate dehydrogenase [Rubrivivax sp.]
MLADADRYFVLGNPVAHSQSPFIHQAFAQQTGQRLIYDRRWCPMDGFEAAVRALAGDTEGGRVRGCNVTVPFKFEVPALARVLTPRAALAQAANVLRFDADGWLADNTDGIGLMRDLQQHEGLDLRGREVLVIGAGGAAAGVLGALLECSPARVHVANRSPARAEALVARHATLAQAHSVALTAGALDALSSGAIPAFDLWINASASSLAGAASPAPAVVMAPGAVVVDLMYGAAAEPFLAWARTQGASRTVDGLGMLVEQAAEAFFLWRGVRPQTAPVLAALRERLRAATP